MCVVLINKKIKINKNKNYQYSLKATICPKFGGQTDLHCVRYTFFFLSSCIHWDLKPITLAFLSKSVNDLVSPAHSSHNQNNKWIQLQLLVHLIMSDNKGQIRMSTL